MCLAQVTGASAATSVDQTTARNLLRQAFRARRDFRYRIADPLGEIAVGIELALAHGHIQGEADVGQIRKG